MLSDDLLNTPWYDNQTYYDIERFRPEGFKGDDEDDAVAEAWNQRMRAAPIVERISMERRLMRYMNEINSHKGDVHLTNGSIDRAEYDSFKRAVKEAHKFRLQPAFVGMSLDKLATPETVVQARDFFRLPYDLTWLEWVYTEAPGIRIGAVMRMKDDAVETGLVCHGATGSMLALDEEYATAGIYKMTFYPKTARLEDGHIHMDSVAETFDMGDDRAAWARANAFLLYDFIVRINSPRVREVQPAEDATAINKKREKAGKPPLYSTHTVDLSKDIKRYLKEMKQAEAEGRRLHWRRGHYKTLKDERYKIPGLYWWNPHTAGHEELGTIEKDYVV